MSLLWVADSFYVGSHNVAAAASWYIEKFDLKQTQVELDEGEGCVGLTFTKELPTPIVIGPVSSSTVRHRKSQETAGISWCELWAG
jgi:hypothetical protein